MALCNAIEELADVLVKQLFPTSSRERYLAFVLRGMPCFRDVQRLDLWESAYQGVSKIESTSNIEKLLDEVFELGRYNLYGAYSPDETKDFYRRILREFANAGLSVPEEADVSDW